MKTRDLLAYTSVVLATAEWQTGLTKWSTTAPRHYAVESRRASVMFFHTEK